MYSIRNFWLVYIMLQQLNASLRRHFAAHKREPKLNRSKLYRTPRLGAKTYTRASAIHRANFNTYPAGTNFTLDKGSVPDLAEFCRFTAQYNTLSSSSLQFEVWMPMVENWNGRFAHVGNGVDSGSISYLYMGVPLTKYGFAVASTNADITELAWMELLP
ncbi:feruloyl esterase B [Rhizoctonia solani]|uniref:feruloyl esterase n=1 Tax=Rhizoctonia solani TaxID=456999 RepID=A0A8H8SUM5_9AGAM|nr:feruloyl esterase B [Rhizoctonia solani]QRW18609.1 feruloyl esterase B [Rhizoctonia solani]